MREKIEELALDLLIRHGYRGVSFGDLASALKTTRANIHYHFGSKERLIEEILENYVDATSAALKGIWTAPGVSLVNKIEAQLEYSRKRYRKYNRPGKEGRPWSLIARLRQDSEALTPQGRAALRRFGRDLQEDIAAAIEEAKDREEFVSWMPVQDVALQLVSIANSAGPITQDAGNFDRLEQLYMAFARIVVQAFGRERSVGTAVSTRRRTTKRTNVSMK